MLRSLNYTDACGTRGCDHTEISVLAITGLAATLVDPVRSDHKRESSGAVSLMEMADGMCVVSGPSGHGGFE